MASTLRLPVVPGFHGSVVVTVALFAHAAHKPVIVQYGLVLTRAVLTAANGIKHLYNGSIAVCVKPNR